MLERDYQAKLIKKIKRLLPDCLVLKNDTSYLQGVPDLTVFYEGRWAFLEVKVSIDAAQQPNQDYYVRWANGHAFGAFIYPENEKEVLHDLQHALAPSRLSRLP